MLRARKDTTPETGDADRWGTAKLGRRPGNGVAAFLLPCERGSHRHTVSSSSQGPASALLRFNYSILGTGMTGNPPSICVSVLV